MTLEHTRRVFEQLGSDDPLYAVLTRAGCQGNQWDPEEFFQNGRAEIDSLLRDLRTLDLSVRFGRALDFGCGVGRLTQALARHFDQVVGVDISATMIEAAQRYDRFPDTVRYSVNTTGDLASFEDDSFDFVFTIKTLQHIPPQHALHYIREFMRVLRTDGVAVFQFRNGPHVEPGTVRGRLYHLRRHHLRRIARRLRNRPAYEMHVINRDRVAAIVQDAGGDVVDVLDLSRGRPGRSLRFIARKTP